MQSRFLADQGAATGEGVQDAGTVLFDSIYIGKNVYSGSVPSSGVKSISTA
jgi:hypothetical protein